MRKNIKKEKRDKILFGQIELDSYEELYFMYYISELKSHGYIKDYQYHPEPIQLTEDLVVYTQKKTKKKVSVANKILIHGRKYTPDFIIVWDDSVKDVLHEELKLEEVLKLDKPFFSHKTENGDYCSFVDIKNIFDFHHSNRIFTMNQSDVWNKNRIYINEIVPHYYRKESKKTGKLLGKPCLFEQTFVPVQFMFTDKMTAKRRINYPVRSITEYLNPYFPF